LCGSVLLTTNSVWVGKPCKASAQLFDKTIALKITEFDFR
jgi:hypothetical protein